MIKKTTLFLLLFVCAMAPAQIISTIAGNGINSFSGDGGPAVAAEISGSGGNTLFDNYGNIYFNDQNNSRVRKINAGGIITTIAGTGTVGFYGNGGPATAAEFNQNTVVGFDSSGNMYVTDFGNNQIRKINTSGIITAFAGTGAAGNSGNGGLATAARLNWPCCVITDDTGNVYIADSWNNVIRKVNTSGIITLFAGTGASAYGGDGGPATAAQLNKPFRIIFDKYWNMYVADAFNSRIRKINTSGIITTFAGTGSATYGGDGGPATAAQVNEPYGVCVDTAGNVYIADTYNNRVRVVNTAGIISTFAGNGIGAYSGDGGPASAAEVNYPTGVDCNNCGIYISDWNNHRLRVVTFSSPITVSQDTSICAGDSVQLTASGVGSYKWSPSAGLSCTTCATPFASPTVTTTYTVSCGCSSAQIKVTVTSGPAVSLSGKDTLCAGDSTILAASGGTTYIWSTGSTASSISVNPATSKIYTIQVSNGGCIKDTSIKVIVHRLPDVTLIIQSTDTVCSNAGKILLYGNPNGGTYSGQAVYGKYFYPDSALPSMFNVFYYTVTDTNGCVGRAADSVYVEDCTGIDELMNKGENVVLYPSPGNGLLNIIYSGNIQKATFQVTDLLGRILDTREIAGPSGRMSLNETSLACGMYFYRIIDSGKYISSGKFIVDK